MKRVAMIAVMAAAVLLVLTSATIYMSGRLGFRIDAVGSGSMQPTLDVGAMVISKKVPASELKEGDVIVFYPVSIGEIPIVHRIIAVVPTSPPSFNTKGDNPSQEPDPWTVPYGNVIGKMDFSSQGLGYYISFARSKAGLVMTLILPAMFIIVMIFRGLWREVMLYFKKQLAKDA